MLITIPRKRSTFQDGISAWNAILSDHLGLSQHLEKDVPSGDVRQSRNRTLREVGVQLDKKERNRRGGPGFGMTRPEHFHPPEAFTAPVGAQGDLEEGEDESRASKDFEDAVKGPRGAPPFEREDARSVGARTAATPLGCDVEIPWR